MPSIPLEEAQSIILNNIVPLSEFEAVNISDSLGRIAFEDIFSQINQPPFNRSPLDGYAFNSRDTKGASAQNPVTLTVTQLIYAGASPGESIKSGEAVRLMTGSAIPDGADCVIRQEETAHEENTVIVRREMKPYENFCFAGEDIKKGAILLSKGTRLGYAHAGVLAAQGIDNIKTYRKPIVGLITTGDEISPAGEPLLPGKIYDSNQALLSLRIKELGAIPLSAPPQGDSLDALCRAIDALLDECDIAVTTGGVSVGERDFMPYAAQKLGAELLFHGLNMKPGSPALAMKTRGKVIIALSGNPFAAAATFEVLARPAIDKLHGRTDFMPMRATGITKSGFTKSSPSRRLIRAAIVGQDVYIPADGHSSGVLSTLTGCNCIADIPAGSPPIEAGERIEVILL